MSKKDKGNRIYLTGASPVQNSPVNWEAVDLHCKMLLLGVKIIAITCYCQCLMETEEVASLIFQGTGERVGVGKQHRDKRRPGTSRKEEKNLCGIPSWFREDTLVLLISLPPPFSILGICFCYYFSFSFFLFPSSESLKSCFVSS